MISPLKTNRWVLVEQARDCREYKYSRGAFKIIRREI